MDSICTKRKPLLYRSKRSKPAGFPLLPISRTGRKKPEPRGGREDGGGLPPSGTGEARGRADWNPAPNTGCSYLGTPYLNSVLDRTRMGPAPVGKIGASERGKKEKRGRRVLWSLQAVSQLLVRCSCRGKAKQRKQSVRPVVRGRWLNWAPRSASGLAALGDGTGGRGRFFAGPSCRYRSAVLRRPCAGARRRRRGRKRGKQWRRSGKWGQPVKSNLPPLPILFAASCAGWNPFSVQRDEETGKSTRKGCSSEQTTETGQGQCLPDGPGRCFNTNYYWTLIAYLALSYGSWPACSGSMLMLHLYLKRGRKCASGRAGQSTGRGPRASSRFALEIDPEAGHSAFQWTVVVCFLCPLRSAPELWTASQPSSSNERAATAST